MAEWVGTQQYWDHCPEQRCQGRRACWQGTRGWIERLGGYRPGVVLGSEWDYKGLEGPGTRTSLQQAEGTGHRPGKRGCVVDGGWRVVGWMLLWAWVIGIKMRDKSGPHEATEGEKAVVGR